MLLSLKTLSKNLLGLFTKKKKKFWFGLNFGVLFWKVGREVGDVVNSKISLCSEMSMSRLQLAFKVLLHHCCDRLEVIKRNRYSVIRYEIDALDYE